MKFTEKHLKKIIQEELEAVISEAEGSNEENFVATYRAHLMNQPLSVRMSKMILTREFRQAKNPLHVLGMVTMVKPIFHTNQLGKTNNAKTITNRIL